MPSPMSSSSWSAPCTRTATREAYGAHARNSTPSSPGTAPKGRCHTCVDICAEPYPCAGVHQSCDHRRVVAEELRRIGRWEDRHRRLVARLLLVLSLTVAIDVIG